mgnify:CR=1 FL=1
MRVLQIQTDLDEASKCITLDSKLKGSSSESGSNFNELLQEYTLDGRKIFGTKAVIVDLDKFMSHIVDKYHISEETEAGIMKCYSGGLADLLGDDGMWSCFWDKTAVVHHRDIMRYCFSEFDKAAQKYARTLQDSDIADDDWCDK